MTRGLQTIEFLPIKDKSSVGVIRKKLRMELADQGWPANIAFDCLVAVSEACVNALLHGTDEGDTHPEVGWKVKELSADIVVRNHSAKGWSRRPNPSTRITASPVDRSGGWGLELMRTLMDEVTIEIGPRGTEVRLMKRLHP